MDDIIRIQKRMIYEELIKGNKNEEELKVKDDKYVEEVLKCFGIKITFNQSKMVKEEEEEEEEYKEDELICDNVVNGKECGGITYRSEQGTTWQYGWWVYCKECRKSFV